MRCSSVRYSASHGVKSSGSVAGSAAAQQAQQPHQHKDRWPLGGAHAGEVEAMKRRARVAAMKEGARRL